MTKDKLVEMVEKVLRENIIAYESGEAYSTKGHILSLYDTATAIAERLRGEGWVKNG